MKRLWPVLAIIPAFVFVAAGCGAQVDAAGAVSPITAADGTKLTGAHYNLNIIGVPQDKTADMTGDNGHRIFVPRYGNAKILLREGDFGVLDANGTDANGASFQLPNPDPDGDGVTAYSVFARALGKPGGKSTTTTCMDTVDDTTGSPVTYCSIYSMVLVRGTGKSRFDNVSKELLFVYADTDLDGVVERLPLFGDPLAEYYWSYTNDGLHLAQLRFYEIATTVP
jgi:hypothetical protein